MINHRSNNDLSKWFCQIQKGRLKFLQFSSRRPLNFVNMNPAQGEWVEPGRDVIYSTRIITLVANLYSKFIKLAKAPLEVLYVWNIRNEILL